MTADVMFVFDICVYMKSQYKMTVDNMIVDVTSNYKMTADEMTVCDICDVK